MIIIINSISLEYAEWAAQCLVTNGINYVITRGNESNEKTKQNKSDVWNV